MDITLQYFDDCPNWETTDAVLRSVLDELGIETHIEYQHVDSPETAERLQFRGSPTLLVDGDDPFAQSGAPVGLSCRVYRTPAGLAGSPTKEQLRATLNAYQAGPQPKLAPIDTTLNRDRTNPAATPESPTHDRRNQSTNPSSEEPPCPTPSTPLY